MHTPSSDFLLFTGNANPIMAQEIASDLGGTLGAAHVGRFSDGEVTVEIQQNVRARDVFVVQSTCAPTNDNLMELLIMVDALKRASAERISAVIPYFGYARQDRRPRSARVPITAKVVANMLQAVGVSRVLTMDLHADQIQGFFDIPVDNIYASPVLLGDLTQKNYSDLMVVSPDVGGVVRARALAKQLGCDMAIIDKRRPKANVSEVMHVIGDIEGRNCVIMDDMIDTAGTLVKAAEVLKERGAKKVYAYCTHPVFSGPAIERLSKGDALDEVVITNTIPLNAQARACSKIRQLSVAPLFAETIQRIARGVSVLRLWSEQDTLCCAGNDKPAAQAAIVVTRRDWSRSASAGENHEIRRFRAQAAGYGCEPPSAHHGPHARHRLRWHGRAHADRTRSQRAVSRHQKRGFPRLHPRDGTRRHGAQGAAARLADAPLQAAGSAHRLPARRGHHPHDGQGSAAL
jgi:ribose-phosphate pyrophosphokinase